MGAFSIRSQPTPYREREVVEIHDGTVVVGGRRARFDPADPLSTLCAYLYLVRDMRDQRRERSVVLRRDDVVALAGALGQSPETILDELGTLMGATRAQRGAMATLFAAGALVVGIAGTSLVVGQGDHTATVVVTQASTTTTVLPPRQPAGGSPIAADLLAADGDGAGGHNSVSPGGTSLLAGPGGIPSAPSTTTDHPGDGAATTAPRTANPAPRPAPDPRPVPSATETTLLIAGDPPIPTRPDGDPSATTPAPPVADEPSPATTVPPTTTTTAPTPDDEIADDEFPEETIEEPWLVIDPPIPGELLPPPLP